MMTPSNSYSSPLILDYWITGSEVGIEIRSASNLVEKTREIQFDVGEWENGNRGREKKNFRTESPSSTS